MQRQRFIKTVRLSSILLLIAVAAALWRLTDWGRALSQDPGRYTFLQDYPLTVRAAALIFIGGPLTAVGFPRLVLSAVCGFLLGWCGGTIAGILGSFVGCVIGFYLARCLGRSVLLPIMPKNVRALEQKVISRAFYWSALLRVLPIGNNSVNNFIGGLSSVGPLMFFAGSLCGYIPYTVVLAGMGAGIKWLL